MNDGRRRRIRYSENILVRAKSKLEKLLKEEQEALEILSGKEGKEGNDEMKTEMRNLISGLDETISSLDDALNTLDCADF